jgi:5'-3' exonuclease
MINILIDGNYIFHKTFGIFGGYGSKDPAEVLKTKNEQAMFIRKIATDLCAALRELPTGGRLVFTADSRSWRKDVEIEGGGYKSKRVKDETVDWSIFFNLLDAFGKQLEKMGFIYSRANGAEGDDLLYFWADYFTTKGQNCIIVSGDKDLHQLARWKGNNWTLVWSNNSKNNVISSPVNWKKNWLEQQDQVSIFEMAETIQPDKSKIKKWIEKLVLNEVNPRDFIFVKMLIGDDGDDVPGVWNFEATPGKMSRMTPKRAEQLLESLQQSRWVDSSFQDLLVDDEFLDWAAGYILRLMKDLDSKENRQKATQNMLRNYKLMWLDKMVMPDWVISSVLAEIKRGINLDRRPITLDRIKILEGTEWVTTTSIPKMYNPFPD